MPRRNNDSAIAEFAQSIGQLVRRARAAADSQQLSWSETAVLKRLAKDGPQTTADLARSEAMRPQSMRTILSTLEDAGYIQRQPHSTDARQVNIEITPKGSAMHQTVGDLKRTWLAQTFSKLNQEEREILFAAGGIIKRLLDSDPQQGRGSL